MGDIFSKKTQQTTNVTNNQQVALQGRGQVGISGSTVVGNVTVDNSDPAVALAAIQGVTEASSQNAIVAAKSVDMSAGVANRALDVGDNSLIVATAAINASHQSVMHVLDSLKGFQDRQLQTVDSAVTAAQQTALNATPVSPGAYAEAVAGTDKKVLVYGGIGILLSLGLVIAFTRKNT